MRLLVITQKVDQEDDVLGFFHEWLRRFAVQCETVEVICLYEGAHDLPSNVHVHSLGKPSFAKATKGAGKRLKYIFKFYGFVLSLKYDAVFVHMNPEYLVLGGWWWRLTGKRALLWYSHRNVDIKLRIAARFADVIATSAATSFRLATKKLHILGHGIDTGLFKPTTIAPHERWRIISVGRITPIKRLETAIAALALARRAGVDAELRLVGQAGSGADLAYEQKLKQQIQDLSLEPYVQFAGAAPYSTIAKMYHQADVSLNLAPTGGLDKAVFESMSCGLPTLVSNEGFADFLGPYRQRLLFAQDNPADLAEKLVALYHATDRPAVGAYLRGQVVARAGLDNLVAALLSLLWPNK